MAIALRDSYGEALAKYGTDNEKVVVLDSDVAGSTKSCIFGKKFPDRFFNVGIAEANMTAMAAGFASVGKIPFVNSFAVFLSSIGLIAARAFGSYSKLNMKLIGAYGGLSDAFDGPSHHALEDIAIMRSLPNFQVFVASDEKQTDWLVRHSIEHDGPVYIRLSRDKTSNLYHDSTEFQVGKGIVVRDGNDATIIACGSMTTTAVQAADLLAIVGVETRIVDMFSIKPIDREIILKCADETRAIVTVEEHSIIGGLGGAVAEVLASEGKHAPMRIVGIGDRHTECGPYCDLLEKYGLDAKAIAESVIQSLKKM